jgi:hypothetical protein
MHNGLSIPPKRSGEPIYKNLGMGRLDFPGGTRHSETGGLVLSRRASDGFVPESHVLYSALEARRAN